MSIDSGPSGAITDQHADVHLQRQRHGRTGHLPVLDRHRARRASAPAPARATATRRRARSPTAPTRSGSGRPTRPATLPSLPALSQCRRRSRPGPPRRRSPRGRRRRRQDASEVQVHLQRPERRLPVQARQAQVRALRVALQDAQASPGQAQAAGEGRWGRRNRPDTGRQEVPDPPAGAEEIGAPGFEPGTSPTRTVRATRLRHAPRAPRIEARGARAVVHRIALDRGRQRQRDP